MKNVKDHDYSREYKQTAAVKRILDYMKLTKSEMTDGDSQKTFENTSSNEEKETR